MADKPQLSRAKTWVLIALIALFAVWYYSGKLANWSARSKAPDYTLSAADLMQAYEANEIAADLKYRDKIVLVNGTVKMTGKDITDTIYVAYDVGNLVATVQCFFSDRHARRIADVTPGEHIRIQGRVTGKLINVFVRDCSAVE